MSISFPGRARIDPSAPEALGICDRCGFQYNLRDLKPQPVVAGPTIVVTSTLVCDICYDELNPNLQTLVLPPDPPPIYNARPENFALDEKNFLDLKAIIGRRSMFGAQCGMTAILTSLGLIPSVSMSGVSALIAALQRDITFAASLSMHGVLDVDLTLSSSTLNAEIMATGIMTGTLSQGFFVAPTMSGIGGLAALANLGASLVPTMSGTSGLAATPTQQTPVAISSTANEAVPAFITSTTRNYSFGTAATDRLIFVAVASTRGGSSVDPRMSTVTIGGVAATLAARAAVLTGSQVSGEIWWALVPTGTSGNVDFTVSASATNIKMAVTVYRVTGANTTTPVTVTGTNTNTTNSPASVNQSVTIPAQSATIGVVELGIDGSSSTATATWTNLTKDSDILSAPAASNAHGSAASRTDSTSPGSTNISVLASRSSVSNNSALAIACINGALI